MMKKKMEMKKLWTIQGKKTIKYSEMQKMRKNFKKENM